MYYVLQKQIQIIVDFMQISISVIEGRWYIMAKTNLFGEIGTILDILLGLWKQKRKEVILCANTVSASYVIHFAPFGGFKLLCNWEKVIYYDKEKPVWRNWWDSGHYLGTVSPYIIYQGSEMIMEFEMQMLINFWNKMLHCRKSDSNCW